jgi:hypothetical protein
MERNWKDYVAIHSNLPGARDAFEKDCETLFRKHYGSLNVQHVEVKKGDGGIDVFIGEFYNPITVVQCKGFFEEITSVQITQINNSFNKAKNSEDYELKEWFLCVPRVLTLDEHKLWADWKRKKIEEYSIDDSFIKLKNGNALIDLMKEHDLYRQVFDIVELNLLQENNQLAKESNNSLKKANVKLDNIYDKLHDEAEEQNILIEIFQRAIEISKTITEEDKDRLKKHTHDKWINTNKKIEINFSNKDYDEVKTYFGLSLIKKGIINEVFETYDTEEQKDIHSTIFFKYNSLKEEMDTISILRNLFDFFTPERHKKNPRYTILAQAFVLTFFEDCTIFEKTKQEKQDIQTSLFD